MDLTAVINPILAIGGMGMAVTFVMGLASMISYIVYEFILQPLHLEYLYTVAFILVIASLVQLL